MNNSDNRLQQLEEFLANTEEQSKTELLRELRSQGVDIKRFFQRVEQTVEEGYSERLRTLAASEQAERSSPSFLEQFSTMTREAMLKWFERIRRGEFGEQYQEAALARCRNKDAAELSDEELRSWLEDIGETLGEPEQ